MHFTHDTIQSLSFVAALVGTEPTASASGRDELDTTADLAAVLDVDNFTGRRDGDTAELAAIRRVRTELRRAWMLDRDEMVAEINRILAEADARPQLVRHDGLDWHIHATEADAPLGTRIRVEAALALADVVRADATDRLRECQADHCDAILVDLSRNGSKRFCSIRCGNRMNVQAYRERRARG